MTLTGEARSSGRAATKLLNSGVGPVVSEWSMHRAWPGISALSLLKCGTQNDKLSRVVVSKKHIVFVESVHVLCCLLGIRAKAGSSTWQTRFSNEGPMPDVTEFWSRSWLNVQSYPLRIRPSPLFAIVSRLIQAVTAGQGAIRASH